MSRFPAQPAKLTQLLLNSMMTDNLQNVHPDENTFNLEHDMEHISTEPEPNISYFYRFYRYTFETYGSIPIDPSDELEPVWTVPYSFRRYDHPVWTDWNEIWAAPPMTIATELVYNPSLEPVFKSALFRLTITSSYFRITKDETIFRQGTTLEFDGFNHTQTRFVVEWCQRVNIHDAFLKVVGFYSDGTPRPYSDPDFPSFILKVPLCTVDASTFDYFVPSARIPLIVSLPLKEEETLDNSNCEICWVCQNVFPVSTHF
jgi:hypothetical protein